ncbi:energy-coupling factor transporter transmembrane component T family protein [Angustibacter sp. McL0619]|uniref:energy-coupling factor transporter transmembrane component T family protein n=1 Tax=Angustibacter sp. McL0619 TaxID=3415676 RepID=UPI003CF81E05
MIGLYRPGTSLLHRCPAGLKLALLLVGTAVLVAVRSPTAVAVGAALVLLGYALAGWGPLVVGAQVWPLRWFLLFLVPFQWWSGGWSAVVVVVGTMLVAVAAAGLVTLSTRVTAMLDVAVAVLGPFQRFGVEPDRVALVLALTVRAVPVLAGTYGQARDARRARGLERSPRALLVPLVLRTMRHADQLGEALAARGVDD